MTRLQRLIAAIPRIRALVVGDVMLDEQITGTADRISPEAPVPVVEVRRSEYRPGGAANVAANIASLGAVTTLAGVTGADAHAQILTTELRARGIRPLLVEDSGRPTTVKTRIIAHHQQIARVDREDRRPIANPVDEKLATLVEWALPETDVVLLSDYLKGVLTPSLTARILERCRAAGKPVFVDPKGPDFEKYRGAFAITPNTKEAFEALRAQPGLPETVDQAGEMLLALLPGAAVLITRGEDGMSLYRSGAEPVHIPAAVRDVYDVTGAGDTAVAVLAVCSAAGEELAGAARIANYAAGIVVGRVGAACVTRNELAAFPASQ